MASRQSSSSCAPVIDNVSDQDYMAVVDEVMELREDGILSAEEDDEHLVSSGTQDGGESSTATVKPVAAGRGRPRKQTTKEPAAPVELAVVVRRGRGRPRKQTTEEPAAPVELAVVVRRGRGRPRKQTTEEPAAPVEPAVFERRGRGRPRKQRVKTIESVLDDDEATEINYESSVKASEDTHCDLDHLPDEMPDDVENMNMEDVLQGGIAEENLFEDAELLLENHIEDEAEYRSDAYRLDDPLLHEMCREMGVSMEDEPTLDRAVAPHGEHIPDDQVLVTDADAEQRVEQDALVDEEPPVEQEKREHDVAQQNQVEPEMNLEIPEAPEKQKGRDIVVPLAKTDEYSAFLGAFLKKGEPFDALSYAHVEMPRPIKEEVDEGIQVIVQSEPNPMCREITALLDLITAEEEAVAPDEQGPSRKRPHRQDILPLAKQPKLEEPKEQEMVPDVPVAAEPNGHSERLANKQGLSRKRPHGQDNMPLAKKPKKEEPEELGETIKQEVEDAAYDQQIFDQAAPQLVPVVPAAGEQVVDPDEIVLVVPKEEVIDPDEIVLVVPKEEVDDN